MNISSIIPELIVKDVQKTVDFYNDYFAFEVIQSASNGEDLIWVEMSNGTAHIMAQRIDETIEEFPSLKMAPDNSLKSIIFIRLESSNDLQKISLIFEDTTKVISPLKETDYGSKEISISDPDGNIIICSSKN